MACCIFWASITSRTRKARVMEPLETKILAQLGIADPYAPRGRIIAVRHD